MFRSFTVSLAFIISIPAGATEVTPESVRPKEIGSRTVILNFTVDENTKPVAIDLVSSEATGLNLWAKALVESGTLKTNSSGVAKIAERRYQATISFPLEGDGAPLPHNITPPQHGIGPGPTFPFELVKAGISGGALLKLTIDEKGKLKNVELVRASHKVFGMAALDAVKQWRFSQPAKKDGVPIAITLFQLIIFEASGKPIAPWQWQMSPEPALHEFHVTGTFTPYR